MMAAASLSANYVFRSLPLSRPSSGQTQCFSINSGKPISKQDSYRNLRINGYQNGRLDSFNPHVSGWHESQPHHQTNSKDAAGQEHQSSLKFLVQAYKDAFLDGDRKNVYEIEKFIFNVEKVKNELDQKVFSLSAEISSGKEKYMRLQADFDNFRKRAEKEKLTTRSDAQGEVIESLLPMVDSFERAKQHIKLETEKEKKIDNSYQGIYKQFVEIMRSLRVAAVPTVGKPFDPSKHEAIAREESQEYKEGIVIQELRRGFVLGDQLLRRAMVKVSSGPGKIKLRSISSEQTTSAAAVEN